MDHIQPKLRQLEGEQTGVSEDSGDRVGGTATDLIGVSDMSRDSGHRALIRQFRSLQHDVGPYLQQRQLQGKLGDPVDVRDYALHQLNCVLGLSATG